MKVRSPNLTGKKRKWIAREGLKRITWTSQGYGQGYRKKGAIFLGIRPGLKVKKGRKEEQEASLAFPDECNRPREQRKRTGRAGLLFSARW